MLLWGEGPRSRGNCLAHDARCVDGRVPFRGALTLRPSVVAGHTRCLPILVGRMRHPGARAS